MKEPDYQHTTAGTPNGRTSSWDKMSLRATQNAATLPRFFRIPEAVAYSGVSRTALYLLMGNGILAARKSGRATLIDRESLDRYLDGLPAAEIKAA
ncbi:MAG: helix-turn-helix domain-containing protein [Rhodospirillales bacterium]|nr:helix-turn-helix domain-containing protein [Rhodospirillales bacterium]